MNEKEFLALEDVFRKILKKFPSEWKKHTKMGFIRSEALVLYKLDKDGKQRASQLATTLSITTGGLTGITDKLVDGGYIHRTRDNKDRRVVYLTITEKGKNVLEKMHAERKEFIELLFNGLSGKELTQFRVTAEKLLANFEGNVSTK